MKYLTIKNLMMATSLLLFSSGAFALTLFDVPAGDVSVNMFLAKLFGGALPASVTPADGVANPLADMFRTFNAGILTLGSIFLTYTLVAGTMQTAHDGEMLGKQWSSMWVPIRTALGVAFVVPLQSGYCTAQLLIMWLTVQGVGLADVLWTSFASTGMSEMGAAATPTVQSPEVYGLALTALKIQVCMHALNQEEAIKTLGYGTPTTTPFTEHDIISATWGAAVNDKGVPKFEGTKYGTTAFPDYCGEVKHRVSVRKNAFFEDNKSNSSVFTAMAGLPGAFFGTGPLAWNKEELSNTMTTAHKEAWETMFSAMAPLAQKVYEFGITTTPEGGTNSDIMTFDKNASLYQKTVVEKMKTLIGNDVAAQNQFIQNSTQNGWMLAGSWFSRIATRVQDINSQVRSVPDAEFNEGILRVESSDTAEKIALALNAFETATKESQHKQRLGITTEVEEEYGSRAGDDGFIGKIAKFADGPVALLVGSLTSAMTGIDVEELQKEQRHPLIVVQEMGERLLAIVAALFVGLIAVSVAAGGKLALIASFIGLILFALLTTAIVMAVYTPLMPFLLFLGAAIGWVILVIEAMFAAPIWAVMHLTPGGNDIMGSAKSGYSLMLGLLLRPALLVLGFAAACVLSFPLGLLLNAIFFDSFLLSMGGGSNSLLYPLLIIAGLIVYAVVIVQMLHKVFSLIHIIPDKILRWIGGGQEQLGESAREMSASGQKGITAMATMTQTAATQGSRLPQDINNMNLNKQAADNQAAGNFADKVARMEEKQTGASRSMSSASEMGARAAAEMAEAKSSKSANAGFSAAGSALSAAGGYRSSAAESRSAAKNMEKLANEIEQRPPPGMSPQQAAGEARGYRANAAQLNQKADEFEQKADEAESNAESVYQSTGSKAEGAYQRASAPGASASTVKSALTAQKAGAAMAQRLETATQDPAKKAAYRQDRETYLQRIEDLGGSDALDADDDGDNVNNQPKRGSEPSDKAS